MTLEAVRRVGQPVTAPKSADLIAAQIRRQVVQGQLKSGDALPPEAELMAQFQVSRPTLREALRILEAESLITVRRGSRGGVRITTPDFSVAVRYIGLLLQMTGTTVEDVYEARSVIETAAVAMLARNRTRKDVADLRAQIKSLQQMVDDTSNADLDIDKWAAESYRFHDLLLERSGNKTIAVQGLILREIVATHISQLMSRTAMREDHLVRIRKMFRSFTTLVDLVEARNAEAAEAHWRTHMKVSGLILLQEDIKTTAVIDLFN
jgi:GntR family transcriptional repressor for pyruvate dehydrogenase complex